MNLLENQTSKRWFFNGALCGRKVIASLLQVIENSFINGYGIALVLGEIARWIEHTA